MKTDIILITGSEGEVGHSLIEYFLHNTTATIVTFDIKSSNRAANARVTHIVGDITDQSVVNSIFKSHAITAVFHLAAILSSGGEKNPILTHTVNIGGSLHLLQAAQLQSESTNIPVKFLFPSTIAVYGVPAAVKSGDEKLKESHWNNPITMYGNNKLHIENLGGYFSDYYKFLEDQTGKTKLDFRAVRFPGLLSAETMPTGGTSDYGSEMIHFSAQQKPYACFVSADAKLPFMTMPDAVRALIELYQADAKSLTQRVYNVGSFAVTAQQIAARVLLEFPTAKITYHPHQKREAIVRSWPADIDDTKARTDWGWQPNYTFESAFSEYLFPAIKKQYA